MQSLLAGCRHDLYKHSVNSSRTVLCLAQAGRPVSQKYPVLYTAWSTMAGYTLS
jgi:hypothetical protein